MGLYLQLQFVWNGNNYYKHENNKSVVIPVLRFHGYYIFCTVHQFRWHFVSVSHLLCKLAMVFHTVKFTWTCKGLITGLLLKAGTTGCFVLSLLYFLLALSLPVLLRLMLAEGEAMVLLKGACCKNWMSPVKPPSAADTCSLSRKAFQTQGFCWTWLF